MSNTRRITMERLQSTILLLFASVVFCATATAQVGHPPESSPYRDLRAKRVLSFEGGILSGSSGKAKVGPGSGPYAGARFDLHVSGPIALTFGSGIAELERIIIDPTYGPANRTVDTTSQSVLLVDAAVDLLFTGEKTWHRMIPYVGGGLGMALGGAVSADTVSGYTFATHFTFGPHLGVWLQPTDRITLRIEGRDIMWRLGYPDGFFSAPENEPNEPPVLDPNVEKDTQWVHHVGLTIRLGYSIGRL